MSWQQRPLTFPASGAAIHGRAQIVLDALPASQASAGDRLQRLAARAQYRRNSLSEAATELAGLRAQLDQLLVTGHYLTVTPYQHGVGQLQGDQYSLAAPNAVATLATKLQDGADIHRPSGPQHAIGWLVTGNSAETLAKALAPLCAILPLPEWCAALRRLTASNDLMGQPAAAIVPRWRAQEPLLWDPLRQCRSLLGGDIAQLESLAHDSQTPIDKLEALAARRLHHLTALKTAIEALAQVSGQIWCWHGHGDPASLAAQLQESAPPDHSHSMTVAAIFLSPSPITFWQELTP
ncbi:hypothetical protein D6R50_06495 [Aeromonas veronii]|uniref:Uncharacterized protein n=1 Tax=Aeromonas veronii TaxID=654 RepID=A0A3A9J509_AERVE|nr:hypothetical protein [Aeromonas veronii]RKJ84406.1 hypothetical protein D6R50_22380 [Aeromonas veronii]RKJ89963.1 hypothetical protein D6R50_12170 [Aeromonas veronii]RKJ90097.1 hypothetical protein D6R50_12925 [Aeromonas veronii]RKJ92192.1 hypothetical protein D6R50_06495 [Aeromonas veronii]